MDYFFEEVNEGRKGLLSVYLTTFDEDRLRWIAGQYKLWATSGRGNVSVLMRGVARGFFAITPCLVQPIAGEMYELKFNQFEEFLTTGEVSDLEKTQRLGSPEQLLVESRNHFRAIGDENSVYWRASYFDQKIKRRMPR